VPQGVANCPSRGVAEDPITTLRGFGYRYEAEGVDSLGTDG
jgi:hypothetical protein